MASMVERDGGESRGVERLCEAVVATGVLRRAVRDEHDAARRVDCPPACEHFDVVCIDELALVHHQPPPSAPGRVPATEMYRRAGACIRVTRDA